MLSLVYSLPLRRASLNCLVRYRYGVVDRLAPAVGSSPARAHGVALLLEDYWAEYFVVPWSSNQTMEGTPTGRKDTSHFSNTKFILEAGNTCRKYGLVYLSQEDVKIPVVKYSCDTLDCPLHTKRSLGTMHDTVYGPPWGHPWHFKKSPVPVIYPPQLFH